MEDGGLSFTSITALAFSMLPAAFISVIWWNMQDDEQDPSPAAHCLRTCLRIPHFLKLPGSERPAPDSRRPGIEPDPFDRVIDRTGGASKATG